MSQSFPNREIAERIILLLSDKESPLDFIKTSFYLAIEPQDHTNAILRIDGLLSRLILTHHQQIVAFYLMATYDHIFDNDVPSLLVEFYQTYRSHHNAVSPQLIHIANLFLSKSSITFLGSESTTSILSSNFVLPPYEQFQFDLPLSKKFPSYMVEFHEPVEVLNGNCHTELLINSFCDNQFLRSYTPPSIRPIPPLTKILKEELGFISSSDFFFLFDASKDPKINAAELIHKSIDTPLLPTEQAELAAAFRNDPGLMDGYPDTPREFAKLIENNPTLAQTVISLHPKRGQIIEAILFCEINPGSMEVARHIFSSNYNCLDLYLKYIENCISTITAIKDTSLMTRKAKLFCTLVTYITVVSYPIENDVFVDLISFVADSRIKNSKEAKELLETVSK